MNRHFADWMLVASSGGTLDEGTLERRWEAVAKVSEVLKKPADLVDCLRFVLGRSEDFAGQVQDHAKATDSTFRIQNSKLECQVLANAALLNLLSEEDDQADLAALLLVTSTFCGLGPRAPITTSTDFALTHLADQGRSVRDLSPPKALDLSDFKKLPSATDTSITDANFSGLSKSIKQVAVNQRDQVLHLTAVIDSLREETNILWWLMGGRIRSTRKRFDEVLPGELTLSLASDLSDLTVLIPGPESAENILAKGLEVVSGAELSLQDAVNQLTLEVKNKWLPKQLITRELTPVSLAMLKSTEVGQGGDWAPTYVHAFGQSPDVVLPLLSIAVQYYAERLALRLCGSVAN